MADQRLEQILTRLAQRHAPELLREPSREPAWLARRLASYNLLVLMGEVPYPVSSPDTIMRVQTWADGYVRLYSLLTHHLFPSFTHIGAQYADDKLPVIIVIKGAATPVIHALAGFVSPYIAHRQAQPTISEVELLGLMDTILDELEAGDLPRAAYKSLRTEGAAMLKDMLRAPVRQLLLTEFDRQMFSDIPLPQPTTPAAPPHTLPEGIPPQTQIPPAAQEAARPPMEQDDSSIDEPLFETSIPIFFARKPRKSKRPRPPVPGLPGAEDDEG